MRLIIRQIDNTGLDYTLAKDDVARLTKAKVAPAVIDALLVESERFARNYVAGFGPHYVSPYDDVIYGSDPYRFTGDAAVWLTTLVLLRDVRLRSVFQNAATLLKVVLVLVIIVAGVCLADGQPVSFLPAPGDGRLIGSAPFAISLVYVMYAYSGWNASTYIVGEMRNPGRDIPRSVGLGTLLVVLLYLGVNAAFLRSTPMAEMAGKEQVALVAGGHLFGGAGTKVMAGLICAGLVSTISWSGGRSRARP